MRARHERFSPTARSMRSCEYEASRKVRPALHPTVRLTHGYPTLIDDRVTPYSSPAGRAVQSMVAPMDAAIFSIIWSSWYFIPAGMATTWFSFWTK